MPNYALDNADIVREAILRHLLFPVPFAFRFIQQHPTDETHQQQWD
jgi:hypothetical protein